MKKTEIVEAQPSLIVRLPNWVGDVIMALPALQALQQLGIELFLLGKPWASNLLAATGMTVISLPEHLWQATKKIAILPCDKALLLTNSFSSALLTYLAHKAAIGYKTDARKWLLKAWKPKQSGLHEVQYFWEIAHFASHYWFPKLSWPEQIPSAIRLPLCPTAIANAKQKLQQAKIVKPFWVLCPFAHGTGKDGTSKIWPHWPELSKYLGQQYQLIVCPGKNEEILCSKLVPEATVLSGLTLSEYAVILASAERALANDSGPMHIAAGVAVKTLGIFGASDPMRSHPWGADYIGSLGNWPTVSEVVASLSM